MKVYVVLEHMEHHGSSIVAIFDSKEKALAHIEDYGYSERDRETYIWQTIEEHKLE